MAHKNKRIKNVCFCRVEEPENDKLITKKKELKNVFFCSVLVAREGKNGPQKERTKKLCFCIVVVAREGKKAHEMKEKCKNSKFISAGCSLWKAEGLLLEDGRPSEDLRRTTNIAVLGPKYV